MALLRRFFFRKPPDGLFELCDRVYVFDRCFTTEAWDEEDYKVYMSNVVTQLRGQFPDASFLVFNFREGRAESATASALSEHDMTMMEYPRQFEGCPVLKMELIHHFLRSSESWLSLGHQNTLLMHCERGGWPVLAFMLAALLIYRKQYSGEQRTLEMVYKQAPQELLHLLSPLNPLPSQLRYLQYVSRRNVVDSEWPPVNRKLVLDCIILRFVPNFGGDGGSRPIFRIYGQDLSVGEDQAPKVLYSTPKRSKLGRINKEAERELVKIDINCHLQGDVVVECISLNDGVDREEMMFRFMFNTAFIRSNILILNRDEVDVLWDARDQFSKDFRAEILFSEMDATTCVIARSISCFEEKEGLPEEAFAKVQEIFNHVDWLDLRTDAALNMLQHMSPSKIENLPGSPRKFANSHGRKREGKAQKDSPASETRDQSLLPEAETTKPSEHDDAVPDSAEFAHPMTPSPSVPDSVLAVSPVSESVDPKSVSVAKTMASPSQSPPPPPPPPPPLPMFHFSSSKLENSSPTEETTTVTSITTSIPSSPIDSETSSTQLPPPPSPPPTPPLRENIPSRTGPPPPPPPPLRPNHNAGPQKASSVPPPPPPPLGPGNAASARKSSSAPPPPPPPLRPGNGVGPQKLSSVPPPPPPPPPSLPGHAADPQKPSSVPPPPPPTPGFSSKQSGRNSTSTPPAPAPPPPAPLFKGTSKIPSSTPTLSSSNSGKGRLSRAISARSSCKKLKPLHWMKITRAAQGSLWEEAQKYGAISPEIDMLELESLFSALPMAAHGRKSIKRGSVGKSEKVQLIDHRRAYNCEIMLSKVKIPLDVLMSSVLSLEDSALDVDQVDNLVKFCPTQEEMELLKGYAGEKENLGRCEQFFLELMQVPRVESKLRVFSFKIQFTSQVSELRYSLNVVNSASEEIRNSVKLKRIMQTILSLGNALNQGTVRGSAIGFKLDSLLKLTETRARNNKMTLMHYLCKVLAEKLPEVIDFSKDLGSLESAAKIQLKILAEEMQAISKGLEKVVQELSSADNDGPISENFCKTLKEFLLYAEAEVRSLTSLYSAVGKNVDALILYFGEDLSRCTFEQVISTLLNFTRMFNKAHEENCKQIEREAKKAAESEKLKIAVPHKQLKEPLQSPV